MNKILKKLLRIFFIVAAFFALGYAGYRVYDYIVQDITKRVSESVKEGIGKGVMGIVNPINWFRKK